MKAFVMIILRRSLKQFPRVAALIIGSFMVPLAAFSQSAAVSSSLVNLNTTAGSVYPPATTIFDFANRVIVTFFALLAVIFIGMMLYAGYNWMTAMGEEEKITKAKDTIISSVIGIIIILAAYAVTRFVISGLAGVVFI